MYEAIKRIINHKTLFGLYPLVATVAEIHKETGQNWAEIARISQELAKGGRIYYGRTINGNYCSLTTQIKSQDMKAFINEIKAHLEKVAEQDEGFGAKFRAKCEAEENSIEKCCGYIVAEVQKNYTNGKSAVLTNDEVFGMAMHYYDENLQNVQTARCLVVVTKEELTEEDKERIRREAKAESERAYKAAEEARIAKEQQQKEAEAKKAEEKKRAAEEAKARRAAEAERKRQEELERRRREWDSADMLFNFDDED